MSYIVPFQTVELFEHTFQHQINKKTGVIEGRKFVFDRLFGEGEDRLPVEADRYRLIWMPGCPHSNKAVITLRLLGLDRVISVGEAGILRDPRGWVFSEDLGEVDPVLKVHYLDDVYRRSDPDFVGRSTVPCIADESSGGAVQNDAWNIPKYLIRDWKKFHKENAPDLYPEHLRTEIDEQIEFIKKVNAYDCGFARDQEHYDCGYENYFNTLDILEEKLSRSRFLHGDYITLSDIHLYVALIRFQLNYHLVFGVNKKRLEDYPNLWGYTKDLFQTEAFREYTKLEKIKKHYQLSPHMRAKQGNVYGIVGIGDESGLYGSVENREKLSRDPLHKFLTEKEEREIFSHKDVKTEIEYLNDYVIVPTEKAGKATNQNEYERWAFQVRDAFEEIDRRLANTAFLLGNEVTEADGLLYRALRRHDFIYYYLYKLNFAKSTDYKNIARYVDDLKTVREVADSIDIEQEKKKAYEEQEEERNPYHITFAGPEEK